MSYEEHGKHAAGHVGCAIITVSDSRTEDTDGSGRLIRELLEGAGHTVCRYAIVRDDSGEICTQIATAINEPACQAILLSGGTGVAPRDTTYEAVVSLLEKRLDGFGELFRMLSFEEIGSGAMLSRAVAGVHSGRVIFCMPGSVGAVRLGMTRLIIPELGHIVSELRRGQSSP
jgi:molybdopterin adenylyltransferase